MHQFQPQPPHHSPHCATLRHTYNYNYNCNYKYTTYTKNIILHYTPPHYIILHSTALRYTPLHSTSLHYNTLHQLPLQLQLQPRLQPQLQHNYTTLRYAKNITLHYTTLHYIRLHYTNYTTIPYPTLEHITCLPAPIWPVSVFGCCQRVELAGRDSCQQGPPCPSWHQFS